METVVFCKKYQEELPAMTFPPLPGKAGKDLMDTVSQKALEDWKAHQTTLINERRLYLSQPVIRKWLIEEMLKFFDNKEVAVAEGFVEPTKDSGIQTYIPPHPPIV